MYVDFHSHILPGIDDGAENSEMSLKMLGLERKSGVTRIAATPHFYMSSQSLEDFLEKRSGAFESIHQSAQSERYAFGNIEGVTGLCISEKRRSAGCAGLFRAGRANGKATDHWDRQQEKADPDGRTVWGLQI